VLFIYINFAIRKRDIRGYLAMLLDLPSLVTLKELLAEFINAASGAPIAPPPHVR
jgi:chemotaxis protein CheC